MAHGHTEAGAIANAEAAIDLWIETGKEDGIPMPEPRGSVLFGRRPARPRAEVNRDQLRYGTGPSFAWFACFVALPNLCSFVFIGGCFEARCVSGHNRTARRPGSQKVLPVT